MTFPLQLDLWNPVMDHYFPVVFQKDRTHIATVRLEDLKKKVHPVADFGLSMEIPEAFYLAQVRSNLILPGGELGITIDGEPVLIQDMSYPMPLVLPWEESKELFWATPAGSGKDRTKKELLGYMLPNGTHVQAFVNVRKSLPHPVDLRLEFVLGQYRGQTMNLSEEKA